MYEDRFSVVLFFVIPTLFVQKVSATDPLFTFCPTEFPYYSLNSSFYNNLELLLHSLPSNTSVTGFYNTSIGEEEDKVYGQALCRGDVTNSTVCQNCVEKANQDILKSCHSEDALIWYELCQVRYSFQMFIGRYVYTGKYPDENKQKKNVSDPIQFNEVLTYLMNNLSNEAAFNTSKMFATGEISFSRKRKIYGLAQCTMDMSQEDCHTCLSSALGDLKACCSYRQGGIILSRTCNMRFESSQFFNTSDYLLIYPTSRVLILATLIGLYAAYYRRKYGRDRDEARKEEMLLQELASPKEVAITEEGELISSEGLLFVNLATIKETTDDFSDANKVGQGGFGAVYKAWQLWNDGRKMEFVDPVLLGSCLVSEVIRCTHIGLLCVQENPADRPTMSEVVVQLGSESVALPQPTQPAFCLGKGALIDPSSVTNPSVNEFITSTLLPR
ncbi:hypothetical protein L6164_035833 [Bauhinia variegata]|uniref:Uncharacterized protein n=1 Tax=Bauhinia variegata TaxID=167791 RepID=A0ACB9KFA4_BAUVA|nr:hypothetical protein L6164_035833 [Bauhinia variegata]